MSGPSNDETRLRVVATPPATPKVSADTNEFRAAPPQSPSSPSGNVAGSVAVGQLLGGRYLLERELGAGGMGIVYFARDTQVKGEVFAIKVLKPAVRERDDALDQMREEVRKTRGIAGEGIVGMYSVNIDDAANAYILMEYLEGKTLEALINDDFGRGMPFARAWPLIQDICRGLGRAHDQNVVHSDLKPSNIFITTAGRAKLLDFGIARAARGGDGRFDPGALGALTLAYASCEMIEEHHKPDQRDDIYALGCVIYEMLSGRHPYDSASAQEAQQAGKAIAPIASLTRSQNQALARAMAFERSKRTETVEALLSGLEPSATPGPPGAIIVGLALLILLLVIGLVWNSLKGDRLKVPATPPSTTAAVPVPEELLNHVRSLLANAREASVDPEDSSLQQGSHQLADAEKQINNGHIGEGRRLLAQAATSLDKAIHSGKRLAQIGSQPEELILAVSLCQQVSTQCAVANFADEAPKAVPLSPFELDITTVTNREFAEFVDARHFVTTAEREGRLYAANESKLTAERGLSWRTFRDSASGSGDVSDYPVRGIDYNSASEYCSWRSKRLPTEAEWEFVARGTEHRIFAWGNEPRSLPPKSEPTLLPVSQQPVTGRFGNRGMGDGVLEWVDGGTVTNRVLRGSSWLDKSAANQRLAFRRQLDPNMPLLDTGFRCAHSTEFWPDQLTLNPSAQ